MADKVEWKDTREAAAHTRFAASTLVSWRSRKKGPPYQVLNRRVLYLESDLDAWMLSGGNK